MDDVQGAQKRHISELPADVMLEIFSYLDYIPTLKSVSNVCEDWRWMYTCETLWKRLCLRTDEEALHYIVKSRQSGLTWKESYISNYGSNMIRKKWSEGFVSAVGKFEDLPPRSMCKLNAAEWGSIFEREEGR